MRRPFGGARAGERQGHLSRHRPTDAQRDGIGNRVAGGSGGTDHDAGDGAEIEVILKEAAENADAAATLKAEDAAAADSDELRA